MATYNIPGARGERAESLQTPELGVFEETAPLKEVLMWGAPGTEAVLGQLLPKKISCFESDFNVPEARKEFAVAHDMLQDNGVKIILVKDLVAQKVIDEDIKPTKSLTQLKKNLEQRGKIFHDKYKGQGISKLDVLDWIGPILDEDVRKYGEKAAIVINQMLSLDIRQGLKGDARLLPLSNVIYARDQSNLLGQTFVWSSMEHEIRREEVKLYRDAIDHAGILKSASVVEVPVSGRAKFEGGDGIVHNGICYIGCGGRTNLRGILQVAPSILSQGLRVFAVYDGKRIRREEPEMDAMHLDTFWMPCGKNKIVACEEEMNRRLLIELKIENGALNVNKKGSFMDYIKESGMEVVPLTKYEQVRYAPNFVNINSNKVILSLSDENGLTEELGTAGMDVSCANLEQITKGFGGLHCMTAAIKRG